MTLDRNEPEESLALSKALEQSETVKAKVEACADDLASANDAVKKEIAEGATTLSAANTLVNSERLESKVQECVEELKEVNKTLAGGIQNLKLTESASTKFKGALQRMSWPW